MPVIVTPRPTTYDTWASILNATDARLGKKMPSLYRTTGALMSLPQETTHQMADNGWRRLQDGMVDCGSKRFQSDVILQGIPAVDPSTDPAFVCSLSWYGYTDPYGNIETTPALPDNLVYPLWMSERWPGQNMQFPSPNRPNMNPRPDGIPRYSKTNWNGVWQWNEDAIRFPGSTMVMDFWIYYRTYLPDPPDVSSVRWWQSEAPIMRCQDPLSWWVAREYAVSMSVDPGIDPGAAARWGATVPYFETEALDATKKLVNRDFDIDNRGPGERRRPYNGGGRGGGSGGFGWR